MNNSQACQRIGGDAAATSDQAELQDWSARAAAYTVGNPERSRAAAEWTRRQLGESRDV